MVCCRTPLTADQIWELKGDRTGFVDESCSEASQWHAIAGLVEARWFDLNVGRVNGLGWGVDQGGLLRVVGA